MERRTTLERPAIERRVNPDRRDRMRRINTIHFVGIGGSGMSGVATADVQSENDHQISLARRC